MRNIITKATWLPLLICALLVVSGCEEKTYVHVEGTGKALWIKLPAGWLPSHEVILPSGGSRVTYAGPEASAETWTDQITIEQGPLGQLALKDTAPVSAFADFLDRCHWPLFTAPFGTWREDGSRQFGATCVLSKEFLEDASSNTKAFQLRRMAIWQDANSYIALTRNAQLERIAKPDSLSPDRTPRITEEEAASVAQLRRKIWNFVEETEFCSRSFLGHKNCD